MYTTPERGVNGVFGERLQEIRKDHGDTQQSLADKLHVSLHAVRCWEQNKSDPSHETLVEICRLYHVSADYLLGLTDEYALTGNASREKLNSENRMIMRSFEAFLLSEQEKRKS